MTDDVIKLPQSSYDTVSKIIQAYTQVGDKTSLGTISKILGSDPTVVSRNVGFLMSVGVLEGGRDKGATPAGAKLGRALEFDRADDIARAWRDVLAGHTLVQRVLSAIRVRGGMDSSALQSQVVYTAGVNKTAGTMTGGLAVLEMLRAANLISERDGKFIATSASEVDGPEDEDAELPLDVAPTTVVQRVVETADSGDGVLLRIEVRVEVKVSANELAEVGRGLRDLMSELRQAADAADAEGDLPTGPS